MVDYIAELFSKRAKQQQQQLKIDLAPNLTAIETNPDILERILIELLNNACKYTPSGESIEVNLELSDRIFKLTVANSGVELTETELDAIFDKFYRIPRQDRWQHGGTGLGLALVKKQVEYLGGTIQAKNCDRKLSLMVEIPADLQSTQRAIAI